MQKPILLKRDLIAHSQEDLKKAISLNPKGEALWRNLELEDTKLLKEVNIDSTSHNHSVFTLSPKNPIYNGTKIFAYIKFWGVYIDSFGPFFDLPSTLKEQYETNSVLLYGDSVDYAEEDYSISDYFKHSTIQIRMYPKKQWLERELLSITFKTQHPKHLDSRIQVFVGQQKVVDEVKIKGENLTTIYFEKTKNYFDLIIRPYKWLPMISKEIRGEFIKKELI
ncbi:MAG: hypothetical protein ACTSSF_07125 [Candidatus Heimdallarchaeaceae archaeon]